ncbi:hypothetical protein GCM10010274_09160 [Streptomyces lavendofoliae]|uniref:Uncharacterized protein n=1 Tax=Streptomyces lavendofoliae TaxID=67314 RepID=A0A918HT97_9ACTN|nr:hypothetical protein GCM10010274_09160 [Streptomyces lavendofoliae]
MFGVRRSTKSFEGRLGWRRVCRRVTAGAEVQDAVGAPDQVGVVVDDDEGGTGAHAARRVRRCKWLS